MAVIGDLKTILSVNATGMTTGLRSATTGLTKFGGSVAGTVTRMAGLGLGIVGITSALGALGKGLKSAMDMEQLEVSFGVLFGNADTAKAVIGDLSKFAAETPFEMPELADAGRSLAAFGFEAGSITDNLRMIGDIASGTGQPIGELAEIYGKARVQGRLFGEDVNQLTGRGIPVIQELAKQFGVAESEVKKLVSEGKVGFPQLEAAFQSMTGEGGKFNGMMAAQSQTMAGLMSTLSDNVTAGLREITQELLGTFDFKGLIERTTAGIQSLTQTITFGIRNAGDLIELGVIDWQIMVAENMSTIGGTIVATWDAAGASFDAYVMNVKAGFTEVSNLAEAVGAGIAAAFDAIVSGENPLDAHNEAFMRTLAAQQDAVAAGNPIDVFRDTFQQTLADVSAGMPGVTAGLVEERERILSGIAEREAAHLAEQAASITEGVTAETVSSLEKTPKLNELQGPAALERGSSGAFSAILSAMRGRSEDPQQQIAETVEEQLAVDQEIAAAVKKMAANPPVTLIAGSV